MDLAPGITAELKVPNVQPWSAEVVWPCMARVWGRGMYVAGAGPLIGQLNLPTSLIGSLFVRLAAGVAQQLSDSASGGPREDWLSKLGKMHPVEPVLAVLESYLGDWHWGGCSICLMFSSQFWDIWDDDDDDPLNVCWEGVKTTIAPYGPPWNARGCVDIWDGQLRVNGQPITVAGANVHEMHPLRGKAITEEDMLLDIKKLMLDCTGGMRLNEQKELIIHCNSGMADASQVGC